MELVLYEPDARLRTRVVERLRGLGHVVNECASVHLIATIVGRVRGDAPTIVFGDVANAALFEGRPRPVRYVGYRATELDAHLDRTLAALLLEAQGQRRRAAHSHRERYKRDLVCIGASTGGFPVVQQILEGIRLRSSSVVVCQHIGAGMARDLRDALSERIGASVALVEEAEAIEPGRAYLLGGAGDYELSLRGRSLRLSATGRVGPYRPSFDRLLEGALALDGMSIAVVVLSGLGDDGARHLPALASAGVTVVAQEPSEAVAAGMPRAAIKTGAVTHVYAAEAIRDFLQRTLS